MQITMKDFMYTKRLLKFESLC